MQLYNTVPSRNLIMAERKMLKHADPIKVLSSFGVQKPMPQKKTDTVVFRRAVPIDAGSNGAPSITLSNYALAEGTTPSPQTISYQDVQVTVQQWGVLMQLSSKAESLYEDDIPGDMIQLVGEHMGSLEELIAFGVVKGGTNVVYGNGSARNQITSVLSLAKLRQVARVIEAAHGKRVNRKLAAGVNFDTEAISSSYLVFIDTDLEADVRNLAGFVPVYKYGSATQPVHEREMGAVEQFRFITSPYFSPWLQAGANATVDTVLSNGVACTGSNASDVYPVMVVANDAWGQVAVKGMDAVDPTYLPAKQKTHANPMGQFGYVGCSFWKNAVRLNENWLCRLEVAASNL